MAKSVNEYYSEKMKKLLEMQSAEQNARLSAPDKASAEAGRQNNGRGYYDSFRSRVESERGAPQKEQRGAEGQRKRQTPDPAKRTVIDDARKGRPPLRQAPHGQRTDSRKSESQKGSASKRGEGAQPPKKKISPEQTARDKYEENIRRIEAMRTAKRARVLRKVRDGAVSFLLIAAVFVLMCVVVYRLLFVINDISAVGGVENSPEEIVLASGVTKGDHLFSFSSREVGELMILRCPEICEVDVERTPPGSIAFNVTEEEPCFYADFYGEYRLLSGSLRVLGSVTQEDARALGCIRIILPDVKNVTAGLVPQFSDITNDGYIYEVTASLLSSELGERAVSLDLGDKYDIKVGVDSKYLVKLGDAKNTDIKLNIATAVLEDEMFYDDIKATVDVSDLSQSSVVVDEGLKVE